MNAQALRGSAANDFKTLLRLSLGLDALAADWQHCDRIATYVARMVGHNRIDSLAYANLFSSAFNELLETVFRRHTPSGELTCTVSRSGLIDRIELSLAADSGVREFYRTAIDRLADPDRAERYVAALLSDGTLAPDIGLLELAVDYGAQLSLRETEAQICLVAELALESRPAAETAP